LARTIDAEAWDGAWYRRGYFDDGSPLGSKECGEARIDSLPQAWAAISAAGDRGRVDTALGSLEENLVCEAERMILLFTPPFDKTPEDVGYIKGYPPGVRENGGQYTHGAAWVALAFARQGDGDRAVSLLRMLNPIEHARQEEDFARYKVEPYVVAADIYALKGHIGRGGWTRYTGAAGWMYRAGIEGLIGLTRAGDHLRLNPCFPKAWPKVTAEVTLGQARFRVTILNPQGLGRGVLSAELDGLALATDPEGVPVRISDGEHELTVVLGEAAA
ncbi:MAG: GH36-type glycosyl hydrolase domain-containing protein, partial [Paracoccaceae bacterium]